MIFRKILLVVRQAATQVHNTFELNHYALWKYFQHESEKHVNVVLFFSFFSLASVAQWLGPPQNTQNSYKM